MATPRNTNPSSDTTHSAIYQIRIAGRLGTHWRARFDDMTITAGDDGDTLLTGPVVDQAALHGLLRTVRDLGLPLISVNEIDGRQCDPSDIPRTYDCPDRTQDDA